jgi:hypothetical protein
MAMHSFCNANLDCAIYGARVNAQDLSFKHWSIKYSFPKFKAYTIIRLYNVTVF